ncbi:ABC transporter ATP-binding protein [Lacibacterium aquatile]|uniref:ABC transporter ATP-binding protein n=1 Tax=Lacibacterium aquatile TaxID=1168082 RepID=A0ABW5DRV7_9PROT
MLSLDKITAAYGDAVALDDISLNVAQGGITAVIGTNGAGKTTLIRTLAGIIKPRAGRISFEGRDITDLPSHKVVDLGIGQVAEGRQVFPTLSVRENLDMGALVPRARKGAADRLEKMLELFPRLRERLTQAAGTLSGGEQQMLAIARCLMGRPTLVMLDEPSLGLAPAVVQEVFRVVRRLKDEGLTIVLVEQNVAASLKLADQAYVLETGRVVLQGTGAELLTDARVQQAYLGL